jgi:SAM-dependent methyltransferase
MNEESKTLKYWSDWELKFLAGDGIDIGAGVKPIVKNAVVFDKKDGDANYITKYVNKQFDFVFSSHCLEHMLDPVQALYEWWKLVKTGGILFLIVPDEDLYERGVWPSMLNEDHKHTFTISKRKSWSKVSLNVYDLVKKLPNSEIVDIRLYDNNYNREKINFGRQYRWLRNIIRMHPLRMVARILKIDLRIYFFKKLYIDQTLGDALAQIQCIVRKM